MKLYKYSQMVEQIFYVKAETQEEAYELVESWSGLSPDVLEFEYRDDDSTIEFEGSFHIKL